MVGFPDVSVVVSVAGSVPGSVRLVGSTGVAGGVGPTYCEKIMFKYQMQRIRKKCGVQNCYQIMIPKKPISKQELNSIIHQHFAILRIRLTNNITTIFNISTVN